MGIDRLHLQREIAMSFGITKTIPADEGIEQVDSLYDGSVKEYEFHMAGKPSKLAVGDYVYTIFEHHIRGRLKIKELRGGAVNPKSGKPRTQVFVAAPGERLDAPIPRKGHQGTRYYDGADWPAD
jgi:hypothetical protein